MRVVLSVEYDGSKFHGWQAQPGKLRTVQTVVEQALSKVANEPISVICAGRTDTGVHGSGQVIHFDTQRVRSEQAWVMGTNSYLPEDVAIRWARFVSDDFHARFSALSRSYQYWIDNRPAAPALFRHYRAWCCQRLDEEKMNFAAKILLGEHDFSSFRGTDCQSRSTMRNMHYLNIRREGDLLVIDVTANAFLHHMVRNIVGALTLIGRGSRSIEWLGERLNACDQQGEKYTMPAQGLYLMSVKYPEAFNLPNNRIDQYAKNL